MAMSYEETQKMVAAAEEARKRGIVSAVNYPLTYVGRFLFAQFMFILTTI